MVGTYVSAQKKISLKNKKKIPKPELPIFYFCVGMGGEFSRKCTNGSSGHQSTQMLTCQKLNLKNR